MPKIGDIKPGKEIGKIGQWNKYKNYIFCGCPSCLKTRWLTLRNTTETGTSRCQSCCGKEAVSVKRLPHGRGEKCPRWKGGRRLHHDGYVERWISEEDPYYPMATHKKSGGGNVFEHRLVMAESLGRCLVRQEHVHHKNGIKADNRIENLELISQSNHLLYKQMCSRCDLRKQIRTLQSENTRLRKLLPSLL